MKFLAFLTFVLLSLQALATDYSLIPYRKGSKWGYCDRQKKMVIEPTFDRAWWFADNDLARIKLGSKFGFIDKTGKLVIQALYEDATDFVFDRALVLLKKIKYCIDEKGKISKAVNQENPAFCSMDTIAPDNSRGYFSPNSCRTITDGVKYGIVCKSHEWGRNYRELSTDSIPPQYEAIYGSTNYSADFAPFAVKKDGRFGMINSKNKILFQFTYDSIVIVSRDIFLFQKGGVWTLGDTSRTYFVGFTDWKKHQFNTGWFLVVKREGKWGVIDGRGHQVVAFQFEEILLPETGETIPREFAVKENGKWGFIAEKVLIDRKYDALEPFNGDGYTLVMLNGLEGYIDRKGVEYFE